MLKKYLLFLDESKPTGNINHFCVAGCIIEEKDYSNIIIPRVNELKTNVFGNSNVILHENDIRAAKEHPYILLRIKEKRDYFWINMQSIFSDNKITTIGTAINCAEYNRIYDSNSANEEYFVAMQIILENYLHFLIVNEGVGSVYIESRNTTDDNRLRNHFHTIVANGTLFLHKLSFQKRLTNINFLIKADNNIGLQLADFIPNSINRFCSGLNQKTPSLYNLIEKRLYDGNSNMTKRFGLKKIP